MALALAWKWICSVVTVRNAVSSSKFRTSGIPTFSSPLAIIQRVTWPYWCLLSWLCTRAGKPSLFSHCFYASLSIASHVRVFPWYWDGALPLPLRAPLGVDPPGSSAQLRVLGYLCSPAPQGRDTTSSTCGHAASSKSQKFSPYRANVHHLNRCPSRNEQ